MAERDKATQAGRVYVACPECGSMLALPPPGQRAVQTVACGGCGAEIAVVPAATSARWLAV